jgi:hypothetical protein
MHWNKFRKIRNEVTSLVRNAKDKYNNDLIKKITNMNSSCKNWWNTVKQISGIKGSDMSIPPILHNDNLIFDDIERANLFNIYFSKQSEIDDSKEVRVVFCDISKAFDRVWHKGLIHKLKQSRISGNLLKWFQNYLYGREQRVVINGS